MTCPDSREILSALLDGEADEDESRESAAHLSACLPCRRYQQEIAKDRARLHRWRDESQVQPARLAARSTKRHAIAAAALAGALGAAFAAGRATGTRIAATALAAAPVREAQTIYDGGRHVTIVAALPAARKGSIR
ncbi:MAG: hypothetical protein U0166_08855 [Acidobacteriota bacterium]